MEWTRRLDGADRKAPECKDRYGPAPGPGGVDHCRVSAAVLRTRCGGARLAHAGVIRTLNPEGEHHSTTRLELSGGL